MVVLCGVRHALRTSTRLGVTGKIGREIINLRISVGRQD